MLLTYIGNREALMGKGGQNLIMGHDRLEFSDFFHHFRKKKNNSLVAFCSLSLLLTSCLAAPPLIQPRPMRSNDSLSVVISGAQLQTADSWQRRRRRKRRALEDGPVSTCMAGGKMSLPNGSQLSAALTRAKSRGGDKIQRYCCYFKL